MKCPDSKTGETLRLETEALLPEFVEFCSVEIELWNFKAKRSFPVHSHQGQGWISAFIEKYCIYEHTSSHPVSFTPQDMCRSKIHQYFLYLILFIFSFYYLFSSWKQLLWCNRFSKYISACSRWIWKRCKWQSDWESRVGRLWGLIHPLSALCPHASIHPLLRIPKAWSQKGGHSQQRPVLWIDHTAVASDILLQGG